MTNFPNPEFPISSADCADIEAIFIELIRQRDTGGPQQAASGMLPFHDRPGNGLDLQTQ
jgi:hypothetical protein